MRVEGKQLLNVYSLLIAINFCDIYHSAKSADEYILICVLFDHLVCLKWTMTEYHIFSLKPIFQANYAVYQVSPFYFRYSSAISEQGKWYLMASYFMVEKGLDDPA